MLPAGNTTRRALPRRRRSFRKAPYMYNTRGERGSLSRIAHTGNKLDIHHESLPFLPREPSYISAERLYSLRAPYRLTVYTPILRALLQSESPSALNFISFPLRCATIFRISRGRLTISDGLGEGRRGGGVAFQLNLTRPDWKLDLIRLVAAPGSCRAMGNFAESKDSRWKNTQ